MPQLLFLQNAGYQEDGVCPCIGEPGSRNITAAVEKPGQQLLTEKDLPARDQQMVRQTSLVTLWPTSSHTYLGDGGPKLLVLCGVRLLQHSIPPPTARVRPGHLQGNASLTSSCSQQGWGLASSVTQSFFQKPWGTDTRVAGSV